MTWIADEAIRWSSRLTVQRIDLQTVGLEHLPRQGPVLLAARHYHHFWDGCALLAVVPRPMQVVVTLDWMTSPLGRAMMERLCHAAGWPVVGLNDPVLDARSRNGASERDQSAMSNALRQRQPLREALDLLRRDRALLIFPEAYPTLDPHGTPKTSDDALLPFRPGVLHLAALTERATGKRVPMVPVGLDYARGARWSLNIRLGEPRWYEPGRERTAQLQALEQDVRRLSGLPAGTGSQSDADLTTRRWRVSAS